MAKAAYLSSWHNVNFKVPTDMWAKEQLTQKVIEWHEKKFPKTFKLALVYDWVSKYGFIMKICFRLLKKQRCYYENLLSSTKKNNVVFVKKFFKHVGM